MNDIGPSVLRRYVECAIYIIFNILIISSYLAESLTGLSNRVVIRQK